jgi:hypothetical protein
MGELDERFITYTHNVMEKEWRVEMVGYYGTGIEDTTAELYLGMVKGRVRKVTYSTVCLR